MSDPKASRPHIPGYGVPKSMKGTLAWDWARDRLQRAMVYRMATADADGAPHVIPIWGAWVNDRWYVEGGPTRWKRNLQANPQIALNVEFGDEVVLVEGPAREIEGLDDSEAKAVLEGYAKYKSIGYEAEASNWTGGGLWELKPTKAFAWSAFPKDITRFTF